MNNRWCKSLFFITNLFFGLLLVSCGGIEPPDELLPEEDVLPTTTGIGADLWVRISGVQVSEKEAIVFFGETNLPEQNCLYTKLNAGDEMLTWWPAGKCFPVSGEEWQFNVPLGVEGAPEELEPGVQYRLSVYWPGAPGKVMAEFPFDVSPPPLP